MYRYCPGGRGRRRVHTPFRSGPWRGWASGSQPLKVPTTLTRLAWGAFRRNSAGPTLSGFDAIAQLTSKETAKRTRNAALQVWNPTHADTTRTLLSSRIPEKVPPSPSTTTPESRPSIGSASKATHESRGHSPIDQLVCQHALRRPPVPPPRQDSALTRRRRR